MKTLITTLAVMFWFAAVASAQTTCRSLDISKANEWKLHLMNPHKNWRQSIPGLPHAAGKAPSQRPLNLHLLSLTLLLLPRKKIVVFRQKQ